PCRVTRRNPRSKEAESEFTPLDRTRSLEPLDLAAIVASLRETRRLMVVDKVPLRSSVAPQVVARVMAAEPGLVTAPPMMVTAPDTLVPYAASAERAYLPQPKRIAEALAQLLRA
ncbi:MAG: hypothetical protein OWU33_16635, partial [Firmicutes bacterium]|nr:hypothetical protein [Bacillota bacterium]